MLPSNQKTAEVLEPGKKPFYFPAATISSQGSAILRVMFAAPIVRGDHFNASFGQLPIQLVRVVGVITDKPLQRFGSEHLR